MSLLINKNDSNNEENTIELFQYNFISSDIGTTYVTSSALGYFYNIRRILENVTEDLVILKTGEPILAPGNSENSLLGFKLHDNIGKLEKFLMKANKNDFKTANKIISIKDILVKFDTIKKLMLCSDKEIRQDGIELFAITGNLYQNSEMQEFVNLLNENELKYIMQIVYQEKFLIDKVLTNTLIHTLTIQRIKQMNAKTKNKEINEDKGQKLYLENKCKNNNPLI